MKEIKLQPIRENPANWEALSREIMRIMRTTLFLPLMKHLGKNSIKNSKMSLLDAIVSGQIKRVGKLFIGEFNSDISKQLKALGAKWDNVNKGWKLSALSEDIRNAVAEAERREELLRAKLIKELGNLQSKAIAEDIDIDKQFKRTVGYVDKEVKKTTQSLVVSPTLSPIAKSRLALQYTENLNKYIKDFRAEQIVELRKQVESHLFAGTRYEALASKITSAYGVSERKAQFLARQETNLLAAQVKEELYADAGIDEYEWQTVKGTASHPVRPMHKRLDGKRFKFSKPPITDDKGSRNNPGQDYNCRCTARPIVKF